MPIPIIINFDESRIPVDGGATFRQDATYVWSTIPNVIKSMNASILEINNTSSKIDSDKKTIEIYKNSSEQNASLSLNAKDEAVNAKDNALLARDEIIGYVVPTEATYTYGDIDSKNALQNTATMTGYGNTTRVDNTDRFKETDTPNVTVDTVGDEVRFSDGLMQLDSIETITMPLAPFAPGSSDELLDDNINGVTTQTAHTKGDIVVSGNELNENTYTLRNSSDGLSLTGNTYTVTSNIVGSWTGANMERIFPFVSGVTYVLSCDVDLTNAGSLLNSFDIRAVDGLSTGAGSITIVSTTSNTTTHMSGVFTATAYTSAIYFADYHCGAVGEYVIIKNISVIAIDDIHQAITDTTVGDLVTDTSKFQVIDAITRYDVIAYSKSGYKTYKGIGFYDESMSTDNIATAQGFSKISNGLYSDGTDEITSLRVCQRLA